MREDTSVLFFFAWTVIVIQAEELTLAGNKRGIYPTGLKSQWCVHVGKNV